MRARSIAIAVTLAALCACAGSPAPRLHMLTDASPPSAAASDAAIAQTAQTLRVVIASIVVPQSVDRPQMLVRSTDGRIELIDGERWAEPLKHAIPRALAAQLRADLGASSVWSSPSAAPARPDVRLTLEVTRFESTLGVEAAIEMLWLVRAGDIERTGRTQIRTPVAGPGYDELVIAHRECLRGVSRDIAAAVRSVALAGR